MNSKWNKIKNYFLAGLIAILPLWATYYILLVVFNVVASGAKPFVKNISTIQSSPLLLNTVSFVGTILIVLFLGVLLTNVLGRRLFLLFEKSVQRIPLLSWIYSSIRKLTALFYSDTDNGERFRRVVMIEYPRKGIFVIGFLTTEAHSTFNKKSGEKLVNIFLPTTPNPTSGFLLMVPEKDVILLDISTEDAVKLIVSGGIATPEGVSV